jgi:murein L,D-transpeptidase YcbB/YkuD
MSKPHLLLLKAIIILFCFSACQDEKNSLLSSLIPTHIAEKDTLLHGRLNQWISDSSREVANPYLIKALRGDRFLFSDKNGKNSNADRLIQFIQNDSRFLGLNADQYGLDKIQSAAIHKNNELLDIYCTDAVLQLVKHVHLGRLFTDTSYKFLDTVQLEKLYRPFWNTYRDNPDTLGQLLNAYEPQFAEYDSLKQFLGDYLRGKQAPQYSPIIYTSDSLAQIQAFVQRLHEETFITNPQLPKDSIALDEMIRNYQLAIDIKPNGKLSKDLFDQMNKRTPVDPDLIKLAMDKFKNHKINHQGNYILVNIPAYSLYAIKENKTVMMSKVAVGKISSRTPVMESEVSEIIVMPQWFVPPSILKLPGYIDRKRRNPNFIVRGNRVIQKSGPGNALGNMKFNFKSGDAIYLHDTNEKWAFGSKNRAVSHGCVRVQDYKELALFISSVSPIIERQYAKRVDKTIIDSVKNDTSYTYKYVAVDSVTQSDNAFSSIIKSKGHRELTVGKKVPIYIQYMTCAIKNGQFIKYNDVYGLDKQLIQKVKS